MHIWVVEMKCGKKWEPCAGANLTRKDAEREKAFYWEHNSPTDKFRVKKYIPGYATHKVTGLPVTEVETERGSHA